MRYKEPITLIGCEIPTLFCAILLYESLPLVMVYVIWLDSTNQTNSKTT